MPPLPTDLAADRHAETIPVHILHYVNDRIDARFNEVKQLFVDHTSDEMDRYGTIINSIEDSRKASEERHTELIRQLTVHIGHQKLIETAFLTDEKGNPDFYGHHHDHHTRKNYIDWWNSIKDKAITRVIEYASVAIFAWLAYLIWSGVLAGPKP